jgi:cytochrome c oxidase subunit IV
VLISYLGGLPRFILVGSLTVLAVSKFGLVVAWYMHLKFDSAMFRRMFVFGIILAVTVFTLVLGLFALKGVDVPNALLSVRW